ncbi:hypothetical protein WJ87_09445 [Burkholderia ubonensis]|nr:hypothetical protein WJ87_09445 [Burkholderia ubonensis]
MALLPTATASVPLAVAAVPDELTETNFRLPCWLSTGWLGTDAWIRPTWDASSVIALVLAWIA